MHVTIHKLCSQSKFWHLYAQDYSLHIAEILESWSTAVIPDNCHFPFLSVIYSYFQFSLLSPTHSCFQHFLLPEPQQSLTPHSTGPRREVQGPPGHVLISSQTYHPQHFLPLRGWHSEAGKVLWSSWKSCILIKEEISLSSLSWFYDFCY